MRTRILPKAVFVALLLTLFGSMLAATAGMDSSKTVSITGSMIYWPDVDVTVNASKITGANNLSLGFMLDWHRWKTFIESPVQKQLALDAGFKMIRIFDFRKTVQWGYPNLMPCTNWNENSKTGTWDWTQVDSLTQTIFEIGAEPLFCLGWAYNVGDIQRFLPPGMVINPTTGLPYPESYAAYAGEWVKHFKNSGMPVRYYQIMNEPMFYFGWGPDNTNLANYVELWNTVAGKMRQENPNILLSHDCINIKRVFDYWLQYGDDVDFLDFHKYDADTIGQYSDAQMLTRAEQIHIETTTTYYGIEEARQRWFNARGKLLPVINSESNFNSAWEGGTDPKIQEMIGAVWTALVLRMDILKGISYNVYYEFSSSKSWSEAHGSGWGFGMINEDDNQPWYPYYVHKMMGSNLVVGDKLVEAESSSNDIRSVAWVHDGKVNIVLICKVDEPRTVTLQGTSGQVDVSWIDNAIAYETPSIQTRVLSSMEPLILNGYTVALLQLAAS
jgi:hypothetical protein